MRLAQDVIERPAGEGTRALARRLLAAADREAERLAAGGDAEALHDFRVALRRLRTALRALDPWLDVRPRIRKRLKRCARATNAARDAEVHLAWIDVVAAGLTDRQRAGVAFLRARLEAQASDAPSTERVVTQYRRASAKLSRRLAGHAGGGGKGARTRLGDALASLLRRQLRVTRERLEAVSGPRDEETIHAARIEAKRLRYLVEPLRERVGPATSVVERLKRLQDLLGELHDGHVLARELRRARAAAAGEGAHGTRPGLVALSRRVQDRRDVLFTELDRTWRRHEVRTLTQELREVTAVLARPRALRQSGRARRRAPDRLPR